MKFTSTQVECDSRRTHTPMMAQRVHLGFMGLDGPTHAGTYAAATAPKDPT